MRHPRCLFLVSCGISYASAIYSGLCKGRFRPATSVSRRLDGGIGDYKRQKIEEQTEGLKVNLSGADPMDAEV